MSIDAKHLIKRDEAARIAGVDPRTIDKWRADGSLSTYRVRDRFIRLDRREVELKIAPVLLPEKRS